MQGLSSDAKLLPKILCRSLLASVPALRQNHNSHLLKHWKHQWKSSPHHHVLHLFDNLIPSKKFLCLTQDLGHHQASLLIQLRTSHIRLNQHLFWIHKVESPSCLHCGGITVETVKHFLLVCPKYVHECHQLRCQLCQNADSLPFLLSSPAAIKPLLKYVNSTGRFYSTFSNLKCTPWHVMPTFALPVISSPPTLQPHSLAALWVIAPFWAALLSIHRLHSLCCFTIQLLTLASQLIFQGCSGEQIWHRLGYLSQLSCHLEWVTGKLDFSGSHSYISDSWDWLVPVPASPYSPDCCHV